MRTSIFAIAIAVLLLSGWGGTEAADAPSATVAPNPLEFPAQSFTPQSATSAAGTITVSNPAAGAPIKFSNINPTQPDFAVTGGTCKIAAPLAPGASCTILVTFKPLQVGHRQATLFVEWDGNQVKVKVHLSGVANAPKPASSPTPG